MTILNAQACVYVFADLYYLTKGLVCSDVERAGVWLCVRFLFLSSRMEAYISLRGICSVSGRLMCRICITVLGINVTFCPIIT